MPFSLSFYHLAKAAVPLGLLLALSQASTSASPKFKVLHAFGLGYDGGGLYSSLILDARGDLYSTTWGGGSYGYGTVFELLPLAHKGWKERVLHSFDWRTDGNGATGPLALDDGGNLYGTTSQNGPNSQGAAFELSPSSKGRWIETRLYGFGARAHDGAGPLSGLLSDGTGNFYGTTVGGGDYEGGTVFELTPVSGGWQENVLFSFCHDINPCTDGDDVRAGLIWDSGGNLYGTTALGGTGKGGDWGTAYELKHLAGGKWKHIVLHSFPANDRDGKLVYGGLVIDKSGNLYGMTLQGGGAGCGGPGCGTVYKLTLTNRGWKETVLYNFSNPTKGAGPTSSLALDAFGNLWGTAGGGTGQCNGGCGVVFKMTPLADGRWTYTLIHDFNGDDGAYPYASVIFDKNGNLYGTTELGGGGHHVGVVFEITP